MFRPRCLFQVQYLVLETITIIATIIMVIVGAGMLMVAVEICPPAVAKRRINRTLIPPLEMREAAIALQVGAPLDIPIAVRRIPIGQHQLLRGL